MRKIRLCDSDFSLFDTEIGPVEYDYLQRHWDAFKRMWNDQGKEFWIRFVMSFRSFSMKYGVIKFPEKPENYDIIIDKVFIDIHEQFIDGKVTLARTLIMDIVQVAQNRQLLQYLGSKSFAKDPFYIRETRDVFRRLFGPPGEKTTYLKVYLVLPLYMRFAGSIVCCLRKWLETTEEIDPSDDSYWTPPSKDIETDQQSRNDDIDPIFSIFSLEMLSGNPEGPMHLIGWNHGDPRFCDPSNPLYNPKASKRSDWRDNVDIQRFRQFYEYVKSKRTVQESGVQTQGKAPKVKVDACTDTETDIIELVSRLPEVSSATSAGGKKKRNRNKKKKKGGQGEEAGFAAAAQIVADFSSKAVGDQKSGPSTLLTMSDSCNAHGDTANEATHTPEAVRGVPCTHNSCQHHHHHHHSSPPPSVLMLLYKVEGIIYVRLSRKPSSSVKEVYRSLSDSGKWVVPEKKAQNNYDVRPLCETLSLPAVLDDLLFGPTPDQAKGIKLLLPEKVLTYYKRINSTQTDEENIKACNMRALALISDNIDNIHLVETEKGYKPMGTPQQPTGGSLNVTVHDCKVKWDSRAQGNCGWIKAIFTMIFDNARNSANMTLKGTSSQATFEFLPDNIGMVSLNPDCCEFQLNTGVKVWAVIKDAKMRELLMYIMSNLQGFRKLSRQLQPDVGNRPMPVPNHGPGGPIPMPSPGSQGPRPNGTPQGPAPMPTPTPGAQHGCSHGGACGQAGPHGAGACHLATHQHLHQVHVHTHQQQHQVRLQQHVVYGAGKGKGKGKVKVPPGMVKIEASSQNVSMQGGHMNINIPDLAGSINIGLNPGEGQPHAHIKKGGPKNMQVHLNLNGLTQDLGTINLNPDLKASSASSSPSKKTSTKTTTHSTTQNVTVTGVDPNKPFAPTVTTTTTTSTTDEPKSKKNKKVAKKPTPADLNNKTPSSPSAENQAPKDLPADMASFRFTSTKTLDPNGAEDKDVTASAVRKLRVCSHCGSEEPKPKAYKKCQRCKEEGITNVRYYCGRDCQLEDWTACHKQEHNDKLLD